MRKFDWQKHAPAGQTPADFAALAHDNGDALEYRVREYIESARSCEWFGPPDTLNDDAAKDMLNHIERALAMRETQP